MADAPKSGGLGLLSLGGKPKGEASESEPAGGEAKKLAAEAFLSAVKGSDASALAEAFENLLDACKSGPAPAIDD